MRTGNVFFERMANRGLSRSKRGRSFRRRLLSLENLEGRAVMAASPLAGAADSSSVADVSSGTIARIVNGTVTANYPSVGLIGDTSGFHCTGTLIAPQYVLTAGHCAEGIGATAGRFKLGDTVYATTAVYIHPNYNGNAIGSDSANDIAIFKLDRPVTNVTPSPIYRGSPSVGQLLTLVGFGGGGTGTTGHDGSFGTKRVGTTPIDSVSSKLISWRFDNNTESNTAPGDSGGPAFVNVGGVNYVAGVTSGGDRDDAAIGDNSFDTRVDAYATWIDSIIGVVTNPGTVVSVTATDAAAAETITGQIANSGVYTITRTGSTTSALTVNITMSGTATNGTDYNAIPTTVTIPAGAASATVVLSVRDDGLVEGPETATLTVAAGTGYTVNSTSRQANVSIADNEVAKSNDRFADRVKLVGASVQTTGSNVGATRESGEPNVLNISGGKSVWWTWTATVSGQVTISTAGSNFDTTLGVYRGTTVNSLTLVRANDDENYAAGVYSSKVTFSAVAGQTYQIVVDGYGQANGSIRLSLDQPVGRGTARLAANTGRTVLLERAYAASEFLESLASESRRMNILRYASTGSWRGSSMLQDAVFAGCVERG